MITCEKVSGKEVKEIICNNHYTHTFPQAVKECFLGRDEGGNISAVSVYSIPANRFCFSCLDLPQGWELSRVWFADGHQHNLPSQWLAQTLRIVPQDIIVSYADSTVKHVGYLYQCLNFIYVGSTLPERRLWFNGKLITRRSLGRRRGVKESEDWERLISLGATPFKSSPKHKYLYIKDRKLRKIFAERYGKPYPKEVKE